MKFCFHVRSTKREILLKIGFTKGTGSICTAYRIFFVDRLFLHVLFAKIDLSQSLNSTELGLVQFSYFIDVLILFYFKNGLLNYNYLNTTKIYENGAFCKKINPQVKYFVFTCLVLYTKTQCFSQCMLMFTSKEISLGITKGFQLCKLIGFNINGKVVHMAQIYSNSSQNSRELNKIMINKRVYFYKPMFLDKQIIIFRDTTIEVDRQKTNRRTQKKGKDY